MTAQGSGWEQATSRRSIPLGVALAIGIVGLLTGVRVTRLTLHPDVPAEIPSHPPSLETATDPPSQAHGGADQEPPTVVVPLVEGLTMAEA